MEPRSQTRGLYGQRPSKSADAVRREQFAQMAAMTPRERILKAFELGELMQYFVERYAVKRSR
jgi:hypothetical protein